MGFASQFVPFGIWTEDMRERGEVVRTSSCDCSQPWCRTLIVKWKDGEETEVCSSSIKPIDTDSTRFKNLVYTMFNTLNYTKYQLDHTIR